MLFMKQINRQQQIFSSDINLGDNGGADQWVVNDAAGINSNESK